MFLADTGTSNGDITGQTRPINTVDFKVRNVIIMNVKIKIVKLRSRSRSGPGPGQVQKVQGLRTKDLDLG